MPTNFKTYEAQARLLAAVIAAHPELRLDHKAIAKHYGSDMTASAIEHRFRPIKKQVAVIRSAVRQNVDVKDIQDIVTMTDKEIAKYYGESTPGGIEFQFRGVKRDAKALIDAHNNGGDPATALGARIPSTPKTPKRKAEGVPKSGGGSTSKKIKKELDKELLDLSDSKAISHLPPLAMTPSKRQRQQSATAEPETMLTPAESYDGAGDFKQPTYQPSCVEHSFVKSEGTSFHTSQATYTMSMSHPISGQDFLLSPEDDFVDEI